MKRLSLPFVALIAIMLFLGGISCLDADDDDDTGGAPSDDDDDDNDAGDDDDDNDDDNDDDTIDYTQEPLAVLSCDARCADVGDPVTFSAEESSDPSGGSLTYRIDFGDGESTTETLVDHAYGAPGAYRAQLTVTNTQGLSDRSSCIVSVGDFPTGVGAIDEIAFVPNAFDSKLREPGEQPEHGGLILGFFVPEQNASPNEILINGLPGNPDQGDVTWCEVIGDMITAGDVAILRCHSHSERFDPGQTISVAIKDGETVVWNRQTVLSVPTLTPSYITGGVLEDEILVHVRNDADRTLEITGLSIDGLDVSDFVAIDNPVVEPGEVGIIRVLQCDGYDYGQWRVFTVHGGDTKTELSVSRSLRLFPPVFPVGDWNSDSAFDDEEELQRYLNRGINLFKYEPNDEHPPSQVMSWAETYDFHVFTHKGTPDSYLLSFIVNYGDHPKVLGNAVSGEPEFGDETPEDTLEKLRLNRFLWGEKSLWVYNACASDFPAWGTLPDISGMDHYCVWRPKCNTTMWPPFNWDLVEKAGIYAEQIKLAAEPRPVWNWTQGLNTMWSSRCTTDDEIRSQWYLVLSRGSKGMLWYQYKPSIEDQCPVRASEQIARVATELEAIRDVLLEGDLAAAGVVAFSPAQKLDVAATVSPYGMVVFITNLWYEFHFVTPYTWNERTDIAIDLSPPMGFEPMTYYLIDGDEKIELEGAKVGEREWRFLLPALKVAAAVLVIPEP